jgi:phosphoglycerate dehydrogenase-like enzyme
VIRGGALDSFDPEPPAPDNPLFGLDQMVLTPHVGGQTDVSRRRLSLTLCEQMWALLHGEEAHVVGGEAWL